MTKKFFVLLLATMLFVGNVVASTTFVKDGLTFKVIGDNAVEVSYGLKTFKDELTIPETVDYMGQSYSVTAIGDCAFAGCDSLETVTIPSSVTSIGKAAFTSCSMLTSCTIPEGVTKIDFSTFSGCVSLTEVTLPSTLKEIGMWAFQACTSLEDITIPTGVETIGTAAFEYCTSLYWVKLPDTVVTLDNLAFNGCTSLVHVKMSSKINAINYGILNECHANKELTVPAAVKEMNDIGVSKKLKSFYIQTDTIYPGLKNQTLYNGKRIGLYVYRDVYDKEYYQNDPEWTEKFYIGWAVPIETSSSSTKVTMADGTVKSVNYKSMCRDFDMDFSDASITSPDLKVYYAESTDETKGEVNMKEIDYIPARTGENHDQYHGVILEGAPNTTYYCKLGRPTTNGDAGELENNLLVGAPEYTYVEPSGVNERTGQMCNNYGLKNGAFAKYSEAGYIAYNKAYLALPQILAASKSYSIAFHDYNGTTHIADLKEVQDAMDDDKYYDAAGVASTTAHKGLNIYRGKKFVNK